MLFGAWCNWLCRQHWPAFQEKSAQKEFERAVAMVEEALASTPGDFFLEEGISTADVIFTPYIERMSASLFYYKGYVLRCPEQNPNVARWFDAMETKETYRGTQSDFHTHVHDLPPQMGGCYESNEPEQQRCKTLIDEGPWADGSIPDAGFGEPPTAVDEAVARTVKHCKFCSVSEHRFILMSSRPIHLIFLPVSIYTDPSNLTWFTVSFQSGFQNSKKLPT
jgi:glutathione S-transferase